MAKLGLISSLVALVAALTFASMSASAEDVTPCKRTDFKTALVKDACTKGFGDKKAGQEAAKEAMKKFNKDNNIKSCNDCHSKLAPSYDLKDTALKHYQELGGK